jgi:hypothetical protein
VRVDGQRWRAILTLSVSQEYGQGLSTLQIVGRDPPVTLTPGQAVTMRWGYDGYEVPGFTGTIVVAEPQSYPNRWTVQVNDALWPAAREGQPIATVPLNDITAQAAIQYILETYAGITRHDIPDIAKPSDSGVSWTLGTLTPVSWESDTTALAACQEIASMAGYWLYADAGGTVRARQMERRPSSSPFCVFERGVNLLVQGAPRRRQDATQVRNRITVRGANTGVEGAQLFDTFVATHALLADVQSPMEVSSFLLEVIADVTAVAERTAGVWNRVPNVVSGRIKADPRLSVGTTVGIKDRNIGYTTTKPFFIYRLTTSLDLLAGRFDQDLILDGGVGDAGYTTIPPPVAVASYTIELETADGTAIAVVTVDGSASYSQSDGEIVSYAWSTSGVVSSTPTTASTAVATFLYPVSAGSVTITLTVTDTTSKTGTTDLVIDLAAPDVPADVESLNVAFGAAWLTTGDGGASWGQHIATTTRVPPIGGGGWESAPSGDADTYGILASGGTALRQSLDALATAPTTINTASGSITALAVNAKNASRVWRAIGPLVQRSIDGGVTFTDWGTPLAGVDVLDIIEDPALNNSVFALAGADMYQSLGDGAPGWLVFYAGPTGATARWMQRSESGQITWICYTGTFTGAPLHRVEGPIEVTPGTATEIRAIALLDAVSAVAPVLVAIDQDAAIYHIDGLTGDVLATSTATYPAGAIVQHAMPGQKAAIVYTADFDSVVAGTGAVRKYFPDSQTLLLYKAGDTGQQAHMVGLTGIGRQPPEVMVLRLPTGASGDADKLFIYASGTWTAKALPESGRSDWRRIVASPFDPDKLLLYRCDLSSGVNMANNKLWYSDDGGDSWTAVFENLTLRTDQAYPPVEWSPTVPTEWMTTAHYSDSGSARQRLIRGTNGSYTIVFDNTVYAIGERAIPAYGVGGELPFIDSADASLGYYTSANVPTDTGFGVGLDSYADTVPFSRQWATAYYVSANTARITANYLTTAPSAVSGTSAKYAALLADATLLLGGRAGVQQVLDPFGTPAVSVVAETGVTVGWVRTDRQTQTLAAAVVAPTTANLDTTVRDASGTWARLPSIPNATALVDWVEVIARET